MKTRLAHPLVLLGAGLGLLGSAGCQILPEAQSDPTRFYVLSATTAAAAPAAGAPVVRVRSIEAAEYLRARPMIVRRGGNEIEFREFARWGEPLEAGVGRVVREELLARGAASIVLLPGGRRETATATFELGLRVLAAEGGSDGSVQFRAGWELLATLSAVLSGMAITSIRATRRPSREGSPSESSWTVFASFTTLGLVATLPAVLPPYGSWVAPGGREWLLLVICGLLSIGGQVLMTASLGRLTAVNLGILQQVTVVLTMAGGIAVFDEPLRLRGAVGSVITLGGVLWSVLTERPAGQAAGDSC